MSTGGGPNNDGSHPCDGWGIQEYEIERLRLTAENSALKRALNPRLWPIELNAVWHRTNDFYGRFYMLMYWATGDKNCISDIHLQEYEEHMKYVDEYHANEKESPSTRQESETIYVDSHPIKRDGSLERPFKTIDVALCPHAGPNDWPEGWEDD